MITDDKIKEFFTYLKENTFISKSANDSLIASIVLTLIENNLINDLYNNIPNKLIKLIESNDWIDALDLFRNKLIELGLSEELISKLTLFDLYKLSKVLKIFIKTPSTIDFIKSITSIFDENVSVAELYLDFNGTDFVFKPYWIVKVDNENLPTEINYDDVYNTIPEYLIDKQVLMNEYNNNNIVLPLKTNLLLINYSYINKLDAINNLIIGALLKDFGNTTISLFFDENKYNILFKDISKIYLYIIALVYKLSNELDSSEYQKISGVISADTVNITTDDLESIIEEYKNIKTKKELDLFKEKWKNYIDLNLAILQPLTYSFNDLEGELYSNYPDIIYYLNSKLTNSQDIKETGFYLIKSIIDSLYFNSYYIKNKNYSKYINVFVNNVILNFVTYVKLQSKTKLFIENFVPIHCSIFENIIDYVYIKIYNNFNSVFIGDNIKFDFNILNINFVEYRELLKMFLNFKYNEKYVTHDKIKNIITSIKKNNIDITDEMLIFLNSINTSFVYFREITNGFFITYDDKRVNINDVVNIYINDELNN